MRMPLDQTTKKNHGHDLEGVLLASRAEDESPFPTGSLWCLRRKRSRLRHSKAVTTELLERVLLEQVGSSDRPIEGLKEFGLSNKD